MITKMTIVRQRQIKILSWNVENLFVRLDRVPSHDLTHLSEKEWQALNSSRTPNKSLTKCLWLAETLLREDADFILLNEVGGSESLENFNFLFLKDRYRPYLIEGNSNRGIDNGFLIKRNLPGKFSLKSHRQRILNRNVPTGPYRQGQPLFSRDVPELTWSTSTSGHSDLILFAIHLKSKLDSEGFDPGGRDRRQVELETLVDIYQETRLTHPKTPIILAGDFNGHASQIHSDPEFERLRTTDLVEVFDVLKRPLAECYTQVNCQRGRPPQLLKIDHAFVSSELAEQLNPEATRVLPFITDREVVLPPPTTIDQRNQLPSDHYPIVVEITCPYPS